MAIKTFNSAFLMSLSYAGDLKLEIPQGNIYIS